MPVAETLAVISAVSAIAGGISGASNASSANARAREAEQKQQELLNQQAELQNEYNREKFEADKENYRKQAEYQFQTAVKDWQYNMQIRALQEKTDAQKYLMSVQNAQKQLTFNEVAEQQSLSREQLALNDARAEYSFQAQDQLVAQLQQVRKLAATGAGR